MTETTTTLTGLDALRRLAEQGARFCKVAAWNATGTSPGKRPLGEHWQDRPLTLEQIQPHLNGGGNAGLLTGEASGGICIIDVDEAFTEFLEYFPGLASAPTITRAGADKGKILLRITDQLPGSRKFAHPGGRHPVLEFLANGRQGVAAGTHPEGSPYRLTNANQPIPEYTTRAISQICASWAGQGLEEDEQQPAPAEYPQPRRTYSGEGDGLREHVLAAWPTLEIFRHHGRANETRAESRGRELRLLGNGGLFIRQDGGQPTDNWYCHSDGCGGGPFEAWYYCTRGTVNIPRGTEFARLLAEMATAAGIPIPTHSNGHQAPGELQPPEAPPPADPEQTNHPTRTFADMAGLIGPIEWAWTGWLPQGMLTILAGESGAGKSWLALRLAACFLKGDPWPDGTPSTGDRGAVLWCEAEAAQAVNLERARQLGLPLDQLYTPLDNPLDDLRLGMEEHRAMVTNKAALPEIKLIIIDSLRGIMGRTDENSSETMGFTKWLAELARDTGKPVLLTHHLRKRSVFDTEGVELERLRGSSAIVQAARLVWALDVPDQTTKDAKRLSVIKSNLARFPSPVGMTIDDQGVRFGTAPQPPRVETVADRAAELLLTLLANEPLPFAEIDDARKAAGISERTLDRAKKSLGIISIKDQTGWKWGLPARGEERIQ